LTVLQLGGDVIELSALKGTPVWVTFVTTTCLPCRDQLPVMNGLATRYADTGLVAIAVDVMEEQATVEAFARELGISFPVALDTDGTARSEWGVTALPAHFWVDAEGIVRASASGVVGADAMADGLRSILPGVEVTP
jgi:thiol-disulfide isomerase/thioredoxin